VKKQNIILIIVASLIVGLIVFLLLRDEKQAYFKEVTYDINNIITNSSSYPFMDTLLHVGLNELQIKDNYILVKELTPSYANYLFINGDLDIYAMMVGKDQQYIIFIKDGLSRDKVLSVISHELIHLNQYHNNDLMVDYLNQMVYWKDHEYAFNYLGHIEYMERPWEKEAFRLEPDLKNAIKSILY
jgi:hypothetical protein